MVGEADGQGAPTPEEQRIPHTEATDGKPPQKRAGRKPRISLRRPLSHPENPDYLSRLRIILTHLAQGNDINGIARTIGQIQPDGVKKIIADFANANDILPTPNDTNFSLPIRTVFTAINLGLVFEGQVLDVPELPKLAPEIETYFRILNSMTPIQNKEEFLALEQRAQAYINSLVRNPDISIKNIIHAAAIWKLREPLYTTTETQESSTLSIFQHAGRTTLMDDYERRAYIIPLTHQEKKFLTYLAMGGTIEDVAKHIHLLEDPNPFMNRINNKLRTNFPLEALIVTLQKGLIRPDSILLGVPPEITGQLTDHDKRLLEGIIANRQNIHDASLLTQSLGLSQEEISEQLKEINKKLGNTTTERSVAIFMASKVIEADRAIYRQKDILQQLAEGETPEYAETAINDLHTYCEKHHLQRWEGELPESFLIRIMFKALNNDDIDRSRIPNNGNFALLEGRPAKHFAQINNDNEPTKINLFNHYTKRVAHYIMQHPELGFRNILDAAIKWKIHKSALSEEELYALKLRAQGYTDKEIGSKLTSAQDSRDKEGLARKRLTFAGKKLGRGSGILATIRAMDWGIINAEEDILPGYEDTVTTLRSMQENEDYDYFFTLLDGYITDNNDGRKKDTGYIDFIGSHRLFTTRDFITKLVVQTQKQLGTRDFYHTAIVYAAAKRAGLIE